MPIYEFSCAECGADFEELVGTHVGLEVSGVVCPECGSASVERLPTSDYSPIHRRLTSGQRQGLEERRGVDLAARKAEFKRKRKAARERKSRGAGT